MNVNDVYEIVQYAANKHQNGYITPAEFKRIINVGQRSYVAFALGVFQSYQPGRAVALIELGQNSVIRQRLSATIYEFNLSVDANGYSPNPGDYLQADAMWTIDGYQRIRSIEKDRWYSVYNSTIDPVQNNPIYRLLDTGFEFAPTNIGQAKMSYVRNPPDIVWGYTEDLDGNAVYDPLTSAQPIWDDLAILDIIVRALALVGVNLQAADVSQYAQMIKVGGQ